VRWGGEWGSEYRGIKWDGGRAINGVRERKRAGSIAAENVTVLGVTAPSFINNS
jgi:hypothetical protein